MKLNKKKLYTPELIAAIIETIRGALVILDEDLRVVHANQSFYSTFKVNPEETESCLLYEIGNNQWNIPKLREILEKILPPKKTMMDFLVEHDFPHIGYRIMKLNAIQITSKENRMPLILLVIEDITDRKNKERELYSSRNLLQSIIDHAGSMLAYLDRDFNYVYVNRLYAENLGYTIKELVGQNHFNLFKKTENYKVFNKVRETGETVYLQDRINPFIRNVKEIKYYNFILSAVKNSKGKVKGLILTLMDTTRRKEYEDSLDASEKRYKLAQKMGGIGTWEWNIETNKLTWSKEVSRLYGLKKIPSNLTYKGFLRMVHHEDRREVELAVNRCIEEEQEYNVDHRIRLPDGSIHWLREKGNVVRNKNKMAERMLGVVMDITSEKKAALEKARLAAIVNTSTDAILLYSSRGILIHWNSGARLVFGYSEKEMVGKSIFRLVPERKMDELNKILKQTREGKSIRYLETIRKRKDGKEIHIALTVTPIRNEKGKVSAISTVERDISHRKEVEAKSRKQHQELEIRVKQRTEDLARSRDKLQQEVEERRHYQKELQSLASGISLVEERERRKIATYLHDQVVQNLVYSNLKLGQLGQMKVNTSQKNILKEVSKYIRETIGDLRNLTFEISPPILYELGFIKAVEWLAQQYQEQWKISVEVKSTSLSVPLDETKRVVLFQSVRECLNNICKHAQSEKNKIFIREQKNNLEVEIVDDGEGFNPEEVKLSSASAHGFGLINIRERLEYLSGSLEIQSQPGQGTRIRMRIPIN
ncbi:MAG: PAS domain S-box protein [bacterium]